eukprot:TRINITY_DN4648_c0_g1_i1.p1 TRINITY_DN4648_c0_g1~~TRINITY_DN4648_c0_g1_i1.p1  ORF type:complete len:361 (+),score=59.55 TRINITY_DN4648_c0_g1_i1:83-1084(+)
MMKAVIAACLLSTVMGGDELVSVGDRYAEELGLAPSDTPAEAAVEYCRLDLDCQRQGDATATCDTVTHVCICTPNSGYVGEICYPEPDNIYDAVTVLGTFVFTFPDADCSQFLSINNAIATFDDMFSQMYADLISDTVYLCGSVSIAVEMTLDARNLTTIYTNMLAGLSNLASNANYSNALQYSSGGAILASWHPDPTNGVPTCIVLDSAKSIIIENVCRTLKCDPGYERKDEYVNGKIVAHCDFITEGNNAPLTNTAIAAIVLGAIFLVIVVAVLIWHFCCRSEPAPANDPFADDENGNNSNKSNEPYGADENAGQQTQPYGNDVTDDDLAV